MARKSRKNIPEVVSSATIQTEVSRPFRAGLYARISMETEETLERGTIETQVELMKNFVADTEDISVAEVYKDSDYSGTNFDLKQVCVAAGDRLGITDAFLLYFRIERFYSCTVFSGKNVFCLFRYHLITLAHQDIEYSLGTNDLGRRGNQRALAEVFSYARYFFEYIVVFVLCVLLF